MCKKINLKDDEWTERVKRQADMRKKCILKAVEEDYAWHPDVTAYELEKIGKSILEKSENNDD